MQQPGLWTEPTKGKKGSVSWVFRIFRARPCDQWVFSGVFRKEHRIWGQKRSRAKKFGSELGR